MKNFFARQNVTFKNDLNRSLGALIGIAQGLICDAHINDSEIKFLNSWLNENQNISLSWPGDVIHARVKVALADGVVTDDERQYLLETLQKLIGGTLEELQQTAHVSELMLDDVCKVFFVGNTFCLTGEFVFASRSLCAEAIERRGGKVATAVSKKLNYLVIGGLGSHEWKHGSFGTKVAKAMALKREGATLLVVHEDHWANSLSSYPV